MITFRLHGNSFQGIEKAVKIISRAGFIGGLDAQDYIITLVKGIESDITGFVRLEKGKIMTKEPVSEPDFLLIFDVKKIKKASKDIRPDTIIVVNSKECQKQKNMHFIDADKIANEFTGKSDIGMIMTGAVSKFFNKISLKSIKKALKAESIEGMNMIEEGFRNVI